MAEAARMKEHIINYTRTQDVYQGYKRDRNKKAYRTEHKEEPAKHGAAKAAFDASGGNRISKVSELSDEYRKLLAEKESVMRNLKRRGRRW